MILWPFFREEVLSKFFRGVVMSKKLDMRFYRQYNVVCTCVSSQRQFLTQTWLEFPIHIKTKYYFVRTSKSVVSDRIWQAMSRSLSSRAISNEKKKWAFDFFLCYCQLISFFSNRMKCLPVVWHLVLKTATRKWLHVHRLLVANGLLGWCAIGWVDVAWHGDAAGVMRLLRHNCHVIWLTWNTKERLWTHSDDMRLLH